MNIARSVLAGRFGRTQIALMILAFLQWSVLATGSESPFSFEKYARLLNQHVDDQGLVDYAALKADHSLLEAFLNQVATLPRQEYEGWTRNDQIALWINAYNACTLKAIIDHYPIQSSFLNALAYPKNSIRQISGVWDKLRFPVLGEPLTLDQMEHQILRRQFGDPSIHVALVCAALSCPPLRLEPYQGSKLKQQFADQTRRFARRSPNFHLQSGTLYLSKIFDWFGEDFVPRYQSRGKIEGHGTTESAVLRFLLPHLDAATQEAIRSGQFRIRYTDYDWTLNEQPEN